MSYCIPSRKRPGRLWAGKGKTGGWALRRGGRLGEEIQYLLGNAATRIAKTTKVRYILLSRDLSICTHNRICRIPRYLKLDNLHCLWLNPKIHFYLQHMKSDQFCVLGITRSLRTCESVIYASTFWNSDISCKAKFGFIEVMYSLNSTAWDQHGMRSHDLGLLDKISQYSSTVYLNKDFGTELTIFWTTEDHRIKWNIMELDQIIWF